MIAISDSEGSSDEKHKKKRKHKHSKKDKKKKRDREDRSKKKEREVLPDNVLMIAQKDSGYLYAQEGYRGDRENKILTKNKIGRQKCKAKCTTWILKVTEIITNMVICIALKFRLTSGFHFVLVFLIPSSILFKSLFSY